MCLVALAWMSHPRWRLVLAGNRDEFHARHTLPLDRWRIDASRCEVLAGRDLQSGGTWLGLDDAGRCAVVTNVRAPGAALATGTTRGSLPLGFLVGSQSAHMCAGALQAEAQRYSPFNLLLIGDAQCAYASNHPTPLQRRLEPGIHGMSNGGLDLPWPKTRRLCEALALWLQDDADDFDPLWTALADESIPADNHLPETGVGLEMERRLAPAFIRGATYGTRASTLVAIDHSGRGWISERRFGPNGVFEGETTLHTQA